MGLSVFDRNRTLWFQLHLIRFLSNLLKLSSSYRNHDFIFNITEKRLISGARFSKLPKIFLGFSEIWHKFSWLSRNWNFSRKFWKSPRFLSNSVNVFSTSRWITIIADNFIDQLIDYSYATGSYGCRTGAVSWRLTVVGRWCFGRCRRTMKVYTAVLRTRRLASDERHDLSASQFEVRPRLAKAAVYEYHAIFLLSPAQACILE